jgi:hypothetical protein
MSSLNRGLRIPLTQMAHLSDRSSKGSALPSKVNITKVLADFLDGNRKQDCFLVFLVGHTVEIEGKVYFVPIEGELDRAASLIDLESILKQIAASKGRQKVVVLDVNRFSPTNGAVRPRSGPMGDGLAALTRKPPEGVQIWSACSRERSPTRLTTRRWVCFSNRCITCYVADCGAASSDLRIRCRLKRFTNCSSKR